MAKKRTKSARNKKITIDNQTMSGFTIIEVVLVLAIAGLIFMMVFIALPQLQRSQRDTQRRQDMSKLAAAIQDYQGNNNGRIPDDSCTQIDDPGTGIPTTAQVKGTSKACRLIRAYLNGDTSTTGSDKENTFVDPGGTPYRLIFDKFADGTMPPAALAENTMYVVTGAVCEGEGAKSSANKRDFAILYQTETAISCRSSNQ